MLNRGGVALVAFSFSLTNCTAPQHAVDEKYYLVSNNLTVPYWQDARAGIGRAGAQLQVKVDVVGPDTYDPKAERDQLRETLTKKPTGIAISAGDANLMKPEIDSAIAQGIPVVTIDADSPTSKRLMFIGTDNYKVGNTGAKVVADKLHGKGNVVVYTNPEQANLKERLRGYNDTFADYPQIKVAEVVDMKGDPRIAFDHTMEIVEKNGKVDAFVSLVSTAGPEIASVLERKNITGKVVVAMDTDSHVLEGIQKGLISATIGQKPFTMAFLAVKVLDDLHHHPLKSLTADFVQDPFSLLPAFVDTGATLVDKSNVDAFIEARKSETAGK